MPAKELAKEIEDKDYKSEVGLYSDHVSFMIDKVPIAVIGDLYKNKHDYWYNGNKMFEYTVDTKDLEKNILYRVVETPTTVKMLDEVEWKENEEWERAYYRKKLKVQENRGEVGKGIASLDGQLELFKGTILDSYRKLVKRKDFEEVKDLFAPYVPHLFLYPKNGIIHYCDVREVTIGDGSNFITNWK